MGEQLFFMMKTLLIISTLLLNAQAVVKYLHIEEGGTRYTQTVTLDYDRNIQILDVPAHNKIVHSRTIFDFNKGLLYESHPEDKICFIHKIPEGVLSMDKFETFLDKTGPVTASKEKTSKRSYTTTTKVLVHQLQSMLREVVDECADSDIYNVEQIKDENVQVTVSRAPSGFWDQFFSGLEPGCHMPTDCLWQTCTVGHDSCYWTIVNCPATDEQCLDHNMILHDCGDNPSGCQISCKPCANLECYGCQEAWEKGCDDVFDAKGVPKCPSDPFIGDDCGRVYCPAPDDVPGGEWDCGDLDEPGRYPETTRCTLFCDNNNFGGQQDCMEDGTWKESHFT